MVIKEEFLALSDYFLIINFRISANYPPPITLAINYISPYIHERNLISLYRFIVMIMIMIITIMIITIMMISMR